MEHYVRECCKVKVWFGELNSRGGDIIEQLWGENLDRNKGMVLKKVCKEREKRLKAKEKVREIGMILTEREQEKK